MDEISTAIDGIKVGISLLSDSINLVRNAKEILPDSDEKKVIEKSLIEADKAAKLAEAQIAQALGYKLCNCTFPPQIMLSTGYTETNYRHIEEFVCPACDKSSIPPPDKPIQIPDRKGFF